DHIVRLWDAATGKVILQKKDQAQGIVTCLAVSPDGKRIAITYTDGSVRLLDTWTGQIIEMPTGGPTPTNQKPATMSMGEGPAKGTPDAEREAKELRERLRQLQYIHQLNLAQQALDKYEFARTGVLLGALPGSPSWEARYLKRLAAGEKPTVIGL